MKLIIKVFMIILTCFMLVSCAVYGYKPMPCPQWSSFLGFKQCEVYVSVSITSNIKIDMTGWKATRIMVAGRTAIVRIKNALVTDISNDGSKYENEVLCGEYNNATQPNEESFVELKSVLPDGQSSTISMESVRPVK